MEERDEKAVVPRGVAPAPGRVRHGHPAGAPDTRGASAVPQEIPPPPANSVPEPPPPAAPEPDFAGQVMTVTGPVRPDELGVTLMHEHVLVDFVGADKVDRARYDPGGGLPDRAALSGGSGFPRRLHAFVDCTPAYLGRDP